MKTKILPILLVFAFLLGACQTVEELAVNPASEFDVVAPENSLQGEVYKGGYGIGSEIAYSFENPIVYEGAELDLPYQIGVNGESTMRLMLFVDGVPQKFELDPNGNPFELGDQGSAWMADILATGDDIQDVSLKFEPNLGEVGQMLCMLPIGLVDAGYPAEINPNGLGEQELAVANPQPLLIQSEVNALEKLEAYPIEFVEKMEELPKDEIGARIFVFDGSSLSTPMLKVVDGKLKVYLRLNNVSFAYRVSLFINGEPQLLDGQLSVLVEPDETVLLEYELDIAIVPDENQIFAVAIPVGQPCMRAFSLAHVSQSKTIIVEP